MEKSKAPPEIFRSFAGRCPTCYLHEKNCLCPELTELDNPTFLTVVMHNRETFKTTNTARLAALALKHSEVFVRGLPKERLNLNHLVNDRPLSLLLTLSDKAQTLTPEWIEKQRAENPDRPFRLVAPDGNWGQASRMTRREPILSNLPWVKLPPGPLSRYRLRYEHHVEGLSTLEAIGRAMSLLDGNTRTEEHLLHLFELMVERTLSTRPLMRAAKSPGT